jgi:hypothetical protein
LKHALQTNMQSSQFYMICSSCLFGQSTCTKLEDIACLCTYVHMHICTYAHMHICTYAHMHICTYAHMYICNLSRRACSRYHSLYLFSATWSSSSSNSIIYPLLHWDGKSNHYVPMYLTLPTYIELHMYICKFLLRTPNSEM